MHWVSCTRRAAAARTAPRESKIKPSLPKKQRQAPQMTEGKLAHVILSSVWTRLESEDQSYARITCWKRMCLSCMFRCALRKPRGSPRHPRSRESPDCVKSGCAEAGCQRFLCVSLPVRPQPASLLLCPLSSYLPNVPGFLLEGQVFLAQEKACLYIDYCLCLHVHTHMYYPCVY